MTHKGSCHCGRIAFEADGDIVQVTECNCSICSRRGYLLWFVPRAAAPYLYYEDVAGALRFLADAFGFREKLRMPGQGGKIVHAEMTLGDGLVMMGFPGPEYRSPKRLGQTTQSLYVYVDDVDAHCAKAKKAGANILNEPEDQFYGDRRYGVEDPEGHHWFFATHVRDVAPEDMKAPS